MIVKIIEKKRLALQIGKPTVDYRLPRMHPTCRCLLALTEVAHGSRSGRSRAVEATSCAPARQTSAPLLRSPSFWRPLPQSNFQVKSKKNESKHCKQPRTGWVLGRR